MPRSKKQLEYLNSQEAYEIKQKLKKIALDDTYNTQPTFSADSNQYPDNLMPFVDKHMNYLLMHPSTNPEQYLSNLRLKTRML